jgi:hypothetical protein
MVASLFRFLFGVPASQLLANALPHPLELS